MPGIQTVIKKTIGLFFDLLFPSICTFCTEKPGDARTRLCQECESEISNAVSLEICLKCGIVLKGSEYANCPECAVRRFLFDRAIPLGEYSGPLRTAVIRLKNFSQFPLAYSIGQLMSDRLDLFLPENLPHMAIPIPKFWMKRLVQGTNSSEFLAREIAARRKIPCFPNALRWNRGVKKQSLLSVTERQQNVRGALELADGYNLEGTHVLLIDDTLTTGSTANEATRCLRNAGVSEVTVVVVGRASHH